MKKLTLVFFGCALFLVLIGAVAPVSIDQPSLKFVTRVVYWVANGVVLGLALATLIAVRKDIPHRFILGMAWGGALTALGQLPLGFLSLSLNPEIPLLAAAHLLLGMLTLGAAAFLTVAAYLPPDQWAGAAPTAQSHRFYLRSVLLTGAGLLLLLVTGVIVAETEATFACPDWPLCRGEIFPVEFSPEVAISLLHRFTVITIAVMVAGVILQTQRRYRGYGRLTRWSKMLGYLFLAQVALGGLYSLTDQTGWVSLIHLGLAAIIWGNLVGLATLFYLTIERVMPSSTLVEPEIKPLSLRPKAATFFKLTKPWIMVLLLITTITAMVIAYRGLPPLALVLYTLLGGMLSAGGASVLNSYIDSDIDRLMSRTSRRATVTGLVTPEETLVFGLSLSLLSFLVFAVFVNLLSALLSTLGILYYVFFYTLYLKRTTLHNIIIGGAAGAIPPLVGWTAVTHSLDLGAFYLFAIIFFWTPPHTWALALMVKKDYAQARVPMLPVVVGEKETTYQIFLYSILLITLTLLPFTFGMVGWVYTGAALLLGARFIYLAWKLWRTVDKAIGRRLYKFSQAYLALLFIIMAVDRSLF